MIFKLMLAAFISLLIFGCTARVSLYPVEGPLSIQRPLPVLRATASGIMGNSGSITMITPDGEHFEGKWSSAAGFRRLVWHYVVVFSVCSNLRFWIFRFTRTGTESWASFPNRRSRNNDRCGVCHGGWNWKWVWVREKQQG